VRIHQLFEPEDVGIPQDFRAQTETHQEPRGNNSDATVLRRRVRCDHQNDSILISWYCYQRLINQRLDCCFRDQRESDFCKSGLRV
jgi:hypothetical protein